MVPNKPLNFRTLDLNLLRVFDEVMQTQSLTKAADKLAITQPAVSNAMRRLREALGDELLLRRGQGMEPTPFAQHLWPAVRDALLNLQQSLAPQTFSAATATSTFVLAMADATAAELIPPLVNVLEKEAPGVSIHVRPLTTRDPRRLLEAGDADLALGYFPGAVADLSTSEQGGSAVAFSHQRLYDGTYVCVMRSGHPLAASPVSIDQFCAARHLLVSFSGRPFGFIDEALASLGRKRRVVLTANQFFTAGRVVANSNLLTVLPRHFLSVTGIAHELVYQDLPFAVPTVHVDALWHQRLQTDPAHRWLRDTLHGIATRVFAAGPR
jgi:DNA-binding transcriptional LysR family regulator